MNLQNMAPNAKRSLLLTAVFSALALCIFLFGIGPTESRLKKTRRELTARTHEYKAMQTDCSGATDVKARVDNLERQLAAYREALLEPLLESYAMRAKSLVETFALEAGLTELQFESLPNRALPLPPQPPVLRHARCPVRLTCNGSYQAAVSFLLRLEKEQPLIALAGLDITTRRTPDRQKIELILEWPVREGGAK